MAERIFTVDDILRMIQIVRKEIQKLEEFREKWEAQKRRFPLIYEGIIKQQNAFKLKVTKLRQMKVAVQMTELEDLPTQVIEEINATKEPEPSSPKKTVSSAAEAAVEKPKSEEQPVKEAAAPAAKRAEKKTLTSKTAKTKVTKTATKRRFGIKA